MPLPLFSLDLDAGLGLPAGAVHAGHTAALHLLTPGDDPLGAWDLRGPAAPGDAACGRPHPHLGT